MEDSKATMNALIPPTNKVKNYKIPIKCGHQPAEMQIKSILYRTIITITHFINKITSKIHSLKITILNMYPKEPIPHLILQVHH
jgi:hypothetical protein